MMEISLKTLSEVNRLLGVVQGAARCAPSDFGRVICDAVDAIDELMKDREKLIELIGSTKYGNGSLIGKNFQAGFIEKIAEHLVANGVTFATDTNAGNMWISVEPSKLIDYIDKAFSERPNSQTRWIDEQGNAIPADVGYAEEWWEDCMKPELLRVFGKRED